MLVVPQVGALELLVQLMTALYTVGNVVKLHLYQSNTIPGPNDTISTYTEADFDGYAAQSLVQLGSAFTNSDGAAEQDFQLLQFLDTGSTTPNTVYGYYVGLKIGAGAEQLIWSERFSSPATMDANGKVIDVAPVFTGVSEF